MAPSAPSPATPCNGRAPSQPLFPLPRAASKPLVPNVEDMDSPDLWQSEAFLEDLQAIGTTGGVFAGWRHVLSQSSMLDTHKKYDITMHHSFRCPKQPAELSCIASIHLTI